MGNASSNEDGYADEDELSRSVWHDSKDKVYLSSSIDEEVFMEEPITTSEENQKESKIFPTPLPQRVKKLNRRGFYLLSKASEIVKKENELVPEGSDKKMTSDEWKRKQEAKQAVPKQNEKIPGERGNGNQLKKLYTQKKRAKDNEDVHGAKNSSNGPKKHKPITWP